MSKAHNIHIQVQTQTFDVNNEIARLTKGNPRIGAVVSFIGLVRDLNEGDNVGQLTLEHYSGMTEKSLEDITQQASERWDLLGQTIIHRVGALQPTEPIVLVLSASIHRQHAFKSCEFMMDILKTSAPFWKKERTDQGERWVDVRVSDEKEKKKWD